MWIIFASKDAKSDAKWNYLNLKFPLNFYYLNSEIKRLLIKVYG